MENEIYSKINIPEAPLHGIRDSIFKELDLSFENYRMISAGSDYKFFEDRIKSIMVLFNLESASNYLKNNNLYLLFKNKLDELNNLFGLYKTDNPRKPLSISENKIIEIKDRIKELGFIFEINSMKPMLLQNLAGKRDKIFFDIGKRLKEEHSPICPWSTCFITQIAMLDTLVSKPELRIYLQKKIAWTEFSAKFENLKAKYVGGSMHGKNLADSEVTEDMIAEFIKEFKELEDYLK